MHEYRRIQGVLDGSKDSKHGWTRERRSYQNRTALSHPCLCYLDLVSYQFLGPLGPVTVENGLHNR